MQKDHLDHWRKLRHRGEFAAAMQSWAAGSSHRPPPTGWKRWPQKLGTPCRILPADLAKGGGLPAPFQGAGGERIDIFINNAGFGVCGSYLETDDAREEEMIRVNVEAMARLFRFAVRRMHAAGGGTILNVASSAGLLPGGPIWRATMPARPMWSA